MHQYADGGHTQVCCSVLQCVWQSHIYLLQCVAVCYINRLMAAMLRCVAVCCSALQCVAVCVAVLRPFYDVHEQTSGSYTRVCVCMGM